MFLLPESTCLADLILCFLSFFHIGLKTNPIKYHFYMLHLEIDSTTPYSLFSMTCFSNYILDIGFAVLKNNDFEML
jgi:hypothetical protein